MMSVLPNILKSLLRAVGILVALGLGLIPLAACSSSDNRLVVQTAKGEFSFNVEVVDTPATRQKGLMFRQSLAPDAGMLFDFEREQLTSFWMQNTLIPLDMVFISPDGVVKTVHVNARPLDTTGISSEVPVQFVLEIPGGRSVDIGLQPGDRIEHPRMR
jgi:uncharacterized membrane protein (UPF0127 family)